MKQNIKYTIYRTKRKNLLLKLKNDGSLALYCPKGYPQKKALDFLYANFEKISRLAEERNEKRLATLFSNPKSPSLLYLGSRYPVLYRDTKRLFFDGEAFYAPTGSTLDALRTLYKDFLRAEAKKILPSLTKELALRHGLSYNRIFIKDISSRFGSCSSKRNVNFSLCLPAFNESFIAFVVLHELAHTVYLNHGKEFYLLLQKICPDFRQIETSFKKEYSLLSRSICS